MRSKLLIDTTSGHENSSRHYICHFITGVYGAVFYVYDQCELEAEQQHCDEL